MVLFRRPVLMVPLDLMDLVHQYHLLVHHRPYNLVFHKDHARQSDQSDLVLPYILSDQYHLCILASHPVHAVLLDHTAQSVQYLHLVRRDHLRHHTHLRHRDHFCHLLHLSRLCHHDRLCHRDHHNRLLRLCHRARHTHLYHLCRQLHHDHLFHFLCVCIFLAVNILVYSSHNYRNYRIRRCCHHYKSL